MKYTHILAMAFATLLLASCHTQRKAEKSFVSENIEFAEQQTQLMLKNTENNVGKKYPRTANREGKLLSSSPYDWTPGFFPGALWYLYELTGKPEWKEAAQKWTHPLEKLKTFTAHHDIGFMMYCSYGNAERLASQPEYRDILVRSAQSLCTRFDERVGLIESWNYRKAWSGEEWFYPVIIDNMMNLELLCYASRVTGDPKYRDIAVRHADKTLKNHFRPDHSSYHVVDYDTLTGKVLHRQTCQGYSDNSTWSRGQAWAVYGYTMMYRETKKPEYLEAAKNFADYFIRRLPADLVPLWDFDAGSEGFEPQGKSYAVTYKEKVRDASASAIVCSALFELGEMSHEKHYIDTAVRMLHSLSTGYRAPLGENANFIIMHCTGSLPHKSEIDAPLTYADYYYLEALTRYKHMLDKK